MEIKIKYINKKIIAGLLAGTMALSLTGCGKYSETSTGGYYLTGSYGFSELETANVYIQKNKVGVFVVILKNVSVEDSQLTGYEILTDARYRILNENVVMSFSLQDYLLSKKLINSSYCKNDFEKIYSMLNEEYIINGEIAKEKINKKK